MLTRQFVLCYYLPMNTFVKQAIQDSGLTYADAARKWGKTPQAVHTLAATRSPRPETLIDFLQALGWNMVDIKALPLGEVYNL